ncbi:MAG: rhodanese-like domain-containing protein [Desulfovibrionales bacterium]
MRTAVKVAGVTVLALALWDLAWPLAGVRQVSPWMLKKRLDDVSPPLLLDVRTEAEYQWTRIPGAVHMPELLLHPETLPGKFRDRDPVIICMTGHRSPVTAYRLNRLFNMNASNLTWGMTGWILSGGSTEQRESTEKPARL